MGQCPCSVKDGKPRRFDLKHANLAVEQFVQHHEGFKRQNPSGNVHMLICAMDYKQTKNPLTSTVDAKNLAELAHAAEVKYLTVLTDEAKPLTKADARQAIHDHGGVCKPDDYFVFYYTGHGTQVKDTHPGRHSDKDDAYCFQNDKGQVSADSCMKDFEIAQAITHSIPEGCHIIILSDCCHSDTIADLSKDIWSDKSAVSMSGCMDVQTSGDTGSGGIFTHSLLLAIDKLSQAGHKEYSCELVYNTALRQKQLRFPNATQKFCTERSDTVAHLGVAWPLVPKQPYSAPLHRAAADMKNIVATGGHCGHAAAHLEDKHGVPGPVFQHITDLWHGGGIHHSFFEDLGSFKRVA
jgi:hypothetical protein